MSGLVKMRRGERVRVEELLPTEFAKVMAVVSQLQVEGERLAATVETADGFEVEAIEHLDFDVPVTCRIQRESQVCGAVASWLATCDACASMWFEVCDDCHALLSGEDRVASCRRCKSSGPVSEMVRFVPLGGA